MGEEAAKAGVYKPKAGALTFDAEGQEGGPHHSRKLHVPSGTSGLTIGRGYDMKEKSKAKIKADLIAVGVSETDAETISGATGKSGEDAKKYIKDNKLEAFEITAEAQLKLFEISYKTESAEVKRVCNKGDTTTAYGAVDWDKLDAAIKEVIIDLKFRGDYTGASRKLIQKHVADNNLEKVAEVIGNRTNWPNVPSDRFNRRKAMIEAAYKKAKESQPPTMPQVKMPGLH